MDSKKLVISVLTGTLNMDWYAEQITANPNGFKVVIKKDTVRRGCTVFVSHPFLNDVKCIFRYYYAQKARRMNLAFSGIVDAEVANMLIREADRVYPNDVNVKGKPPVTVIKVAIGQTAFILHDVVVSPFEGDDSYRKENCFVVHHRVYNKFVNLKWALAPMTASDHGILHRKLEKGDEVELIPYKKKSKEEQLNECISIFFSDLEVYREFHMNLESKLTNEDYSSFVYRVV